MQISQELLKTMFEYKDGELFRKVQVSDKIQKSASIGYLNKIQNRFILTIDKKKYYRYRLIFLYHHGYLPVIVDHIDRDSTNDRIENLREATMSQNQRNCTAKKNGTSKYLGVSKSFKRATKKIYSACITAVKGQGNIYLGYFENEIEAALAYNRAAVKYHGEFANLNIITPYEQ